MIDLLYLIVLVIPLGAIVANYPYKSKRRRSRDHHIWRMEKSLGLECSSSYWHHTTYYDDCLDTPYCANRSDRLNPFR